MNTQQIKAIFERDQRIAYVVEYDGFVPNSYRYRCPRIGTTHMRNGTSAPRPYDAKRSRGQGPTWVAFSEQNGRLASG